jgi:hypothetical protein
LGFSPLASGATDYPIDPEGKRTCLEENGLSFGVIVYDQVISNLNGDLKTGSYSGAGVSATGLIQSHTNDVLSLGIAIARNSHNYRTNNPSDAAETALEATYRAKITEFFILQPDLQYVINPSTDPSLDNALVIAMRAEISF